MGIPQPQLQLMFQLAETGEEYLLRRPRGNQIARQALICDVHGENVSLTPSDGS